MALEVEEACEDLCKAEKPSYACILQAAPPCRSLICMLHEGSMYPSSLEGNGCATTPRLRLPDGIVHQLDEALDE